jgi:hypothetical protein
MSGAIIAAVTPLILLVAGLLALVAGWLVLSSFGPRFRVGRLLASTPEVSVADAVALGGGPPRYVRVAGRIDAEDEFEDEHHRPLVFRRTRLQLRDGRTWSTIDDRREAVVFEIREGLDSIGVASDDLEDGLVVVPRESAGLASEVPDRVPDGTPPATQVRLRVEQVSSVEHAIVAGVPTAGPGGRPQFAAGLGRPLILSTLEQDEAMRILAGGSRRPLAAALSFGAGFVLLTIGVVWLVADALL